MKQTAIRVLCCALTVKMVSIQIATILYTIKYFPDSKLIV
jgi:hypothetical protein